MFSIFLAFITHLFIPAAQASDLAGYERFDIRMPHHTERVAASIWYPVGKPTYAGLIGDNPVFYGTRAMVGAALPDKTMPLIVFSHGSGGNKDNAGWLMAALANRGTMVLALNHPGSTSGDSSPRRSIQFWTRSQDISAAIDHVLKEPELFKRIDADRIYVVGFSLGGLTAMHLGGVTLDRVKYNDYCKTFGEKAQDCLFFAKGGVDVSALPEAFNSSGYDARISKVVAIDPGASYGFTEESLRAMKPSVQIITLGLEGERYQGIDTLPSGSHLARYIPSLRQDIIPHASHFSFLGLCKPEGKALLEQEKDDPVCDEVPGGDRQKTHGAVAKAVTDFLFQ